jgi:predicted lipoprotein with Yx(FWY)xxD motif
MPQLRTSRFWSPKFRVILLAISAIALIAVGANAQAQGQATKRVVKQAHNTKLDKTVLTTLRGLTLYDLSAETNGKFICKRGCLQDWHPLFIAAGLKPTGPVKLGAIKRPDSGRRQVTFQGRPLYTFDEDEAAGDVKGQGFKDVGTWHAVTP